MLHNHLLPGIRTFIATDGIIDNTTATSIWNTKSYNILLLYVKHLHSTIIGLKKQKAPKLCPLQDPCRRLIWTQVLCSLTRCIICLSARLNR